MVDHIVEVGSTYGGVAVPTRPVEVSKNRAALKRAVKRAEERGEEFVDDRISCLLCQRRGKQYKAFNLTAHISKVHGMSAAEYESATGQPEGRGQIVSPTASKKLASAGAKGAATTQALLRQRRDAARAAMLGIPITTPSGEGDV